MKADTIVTGSLFRRFPHVVLLIIVSLASLTIQKSEKATQKFTTLDQYGFLHPQGYTYADSDKYVFTRFFPGDLNYTLGNWEDEIDTSKLPKVELIPKSGKKQEKDQTEAEFERAREEITIGVLENLKFQKEYQNYYRSNIFGYDQPKFFSPDLDGYMHVMQQLSTGLYSMVGKIYLYAMFIIGFYILKASKYFDKVDLDAIPRSLNNRIKDKFFRVHKKRAEKQRKWNFCATLLGFAIVVVFGFFYVRICSQNTQKIRDSGNILYSNIRGITKDLQDASDKLQSINTPGQTVPQSASGGDALVVNDVINDSKSHEIAFNKKAHSMYNEVMESAIMAKPAPMILLMFVSIVLFGFYYFQGYVKHQKYISQFGYVVVIAGGCFLVFLMGGIVHDLYMFREICKVVITKDTKLQNEGMIDIKHKMSTIAEYHLEKYLHCYNFDFNEMIKTQIMNMDVAQLALLKSSKIILSGLSDSLAKISKIDKNPKGIPELLANKGNYMKLPDEQTYVIKYIKKIEAIQEAKRKLVLLPNCTVFMPYFETFMQDVCYDSINMGLDMYWLAIIIFLGGVLLAWGFLRTEILNKAIRDAIAYTPSHLYQRYANDVSKNVDDYYEEDD